jgi:8-oxo-dGTP pyrophosphatase MutT (NUDIX family)
VAPISRLDVTLRQVVADRLEAFPRRSHDVGEARRAAVVVALVDDESGTAGVVLCRRGRVGSHQGQWGLPGGRVDVGEVAVAAARRELVEEVGLDGGEVLGQLDEYITRSGFHLTPFVVWCAGMRPRVASPTEIRAVHHIPLTELVRPDSPQWTSIPQSDRPVLQLPIGDQLIHAPTAAVLYQFAEVALRGRHTRVDDVEEPVFAWR